MKNARLERLAKLTEPPHDMPLQACLLDDGKYHLDPYYPEAYDEDDKGYTLEEVEAMADKLNTWPGTDPIICIDLRTDTGTTHTPDNPAYLDPRYDERRKELANRERKDLNR